MQKRVLLSAERPLVTSPEDLLPLLLRLFSQRMPAALSQDAGGGPGEAHFHQVEEGDEAAAAGPDLLLFHPSSCLVQHAGGGSEEQDRSSGRGKSTGWPGSREGARGDQEEIRLLHGDGGQIVCEEEAGRQVGGEERTGREEEPVRLLSCHPVPMPLHFHHPHDPGIDVLIVARGGRQPAPACRKLNLFIGRPFVLQLLQHPCSDSLPVRTVSSEGRGNYSSCFAEVPSTEQVKYVLLHCTPSCPCPCPCPC
eukprot:747054-Hanusia_phi.AAC.1